MVQKGPKTTFFQRQNKSNENKPTWSVVRFFYNQKRVIQYTEKTGDSSRREKNKSNP